APVLGRLAAVRLRLRPHLAAHVDDPDARVVQALAQPEGLYQVLRAQALQVCGRKVHHGPHVRRGTGWGTHESGPAPPSCPGEDLPMFNPAAYENSRADGHPVLEVVDEPSGDESAFRRFVPLRRTELAGEVTGPLAALKLVQVFGY